MPKPGLLIKFAKAPKKGAQPSLTLDGSKLAMSKLFDVPAAPGQALQAEGNPGWFKVTLEDDLGLGLHKQGWDHAHRLAHQLSEATGLHFGRDILAVEPDLEQSWFPPEPSTEALPFGSARQDCTSNPQSEKKGETGDGFAWHLKADYTDLGAAREAADFGRGIKIAHLDTGYDPDHVTKPNKLSMTEQWNFVEDDHPKDAADRVPPGGLLRNRGHGTGTLGILAGAKVDGGDGARMYLGGAPEATVYPMRIANSVVHFWTSSVAQAINKARELGADVLSMSMGGVASEAWTDSVNAAYEAGLVMVCAAGNNYNGLPTSNLVYPARYNRVIAACGVMAGGSPYHELDGGRMEGNAGPQSRMGSAIAAYTPNIPWAKLGCRDAIDLDGGGTSSATPQVAAAAALWLAKHGDGYAKDWRRVEAVRKALFTSAAKQADGLSRKKIEEYFGNGVLRATGALGIAPDAIGRLTQTKADNASFSFFRLLFGVGAAQAAPTDVMHDLELTQLVMSMPDIKSIVGDPDTSLPTLSRKKKQDLIDAVLSDGRCSHSLTRRLSTLGTRARGRGLSTEPPWTDRQSYQRQDAPKRPARRRLRIFALDPSIASRHETAAISEVVADVLWETDINGEDAVTPGPVGDYLEVIDIDPASGLAYAPVDLDDPYLLAQDGHSPSEGNPQFHQQMVYAVAMKTIEHFENALGRKALWSARPDWWKIDKDDPNEGFVQRLRIYPHALRQANAYYSPSKMALLFGYFPEQVPAGMEHLRGGMVFTCLSHDIVAHETTHALLDGLHRRYTEGTNPDVLAFHEAFADIIAIFQHFTYPEILRFSLARQRGKLKIKSLLSDLARQFGEAMGYSAALRNAIGVEETELDYRTTLEPHDRGSILVAAVFRAFVTIYDARTTDLIRIATNGTGVLPTGSLHPDLVARLADEATKAASHILAICIRALDYCPPVDLTFTDYLRALITADFDLIEHDKFGYRVAFLEAFRYYNVYPEGTRTLSVESLQWSGPRLQTKLHEVWQELLASAREDDDGSGSALDWDLDVDRKQAYLKSRTAAAKIQRGLKEYFLANPARAYELGLDTKGEFRLEVHSVRPAHRVLPDGRLKTDCIVVLTQKREVPLDPANPELGTFKFRGGCTLIINPDHGDKPVRYAIVKSVSSEKRLANQRRYLARRGEGSLYSLYFGDSGNEPFALIHSCG